MAALTWAAASYTTPRDATPMPPCKPPPKKISSYQVSVNETH
jgi:hypothetical protein